MEKIKKKKEELERLIMSVSDEEKNELLQMMKQLVDGNSKQNRNPVTDDDVVNTPGEMESVNEVSSQGQQPGLGLVSKSQCNRSEPATFSESFEIFATTTFGTLRRSGRARKSTKKEDFVMSTVTKKPVRSATKDSRHDIDKFNKTAHEGQAQKLVDGKVASAKELGTGRVEKRPRGRPSKAKRRSGESKTEVKTGGSGDGKSNKVESIKRQKLVTEETVATGDHSSYCSKPGQSFDDEVAGVDAEGVEEQTDLEKPSEESVDTDGVTGGREDEEEDAESDHDDDYCVMEKKKKPGTPGRKPVLSKLSWIQLCFLCRENPYEVTSMEGFIKHVLSCHLDQNTKNRDMVSCPHCYKKGYMIRKGKEGGVLRTIVDVLRHMCQYHASFLPDFADSYKCVACSYVSESKADWIDHIATHQQGQVVCELCGKFLKETSIKFHMTSCHGSDRSRFSCTQCPKSFMSSKTLEYHVQRVHELKDNFQCESCTATFFHKSDLERHVYVWHQKNLSKRKAVKCPQCDFETLEGSLMRKHMKNHVAGKFKCEQCSKVFSTKNGLRSHMTVHSAKREFVCQHCGYSAKKKYHLTRHVTVIHGGEIFECHMCSFKGLSPLGILQHYKHVHNMAFDLENVHKVKVTEIKRERMKNKESKRKKVRKMNVSDTTTVKTENKDKEVIAVTPEVKHEVKVRENDTNEVNVMQVAYIISQVDGNKVMLKLGQENIQILEAGEVQIIQNVLSDEKPEVESVQIQELSHSNVPEDDPQTVTISDTKDAHIMHALKLTSANENSAKETENIVLLQEDVNTNTSVNGGATNSSELEFDSCIEKTEHGKFVQHVKPISQEKIQENSEKTVPQNEQYIITHVYDDGQNVVPETSMMLEVGHEQVVVQKTDKDQ